jgi:uncharacterized heparinase superfamily protein
VADTEATRVRRIGSRLALWSEAALASVRTPVLREWRGSPPHLWLLGWPRGAFAVAPRDPRPTDRALGQALAGGAWTLGEETLPLPKGDDPWNQPSPSRAFAVRLHRFDWLRDVLATGETGVAEALRLTLEWRRVFGRWNAFAWSADVIERRVLNLACAGRTLSGAASDAEGAVLAGLLGRQARHLMGLSAGVERRAERLAAVALAGAVLTGAAAERLMRKALGRLAPALELAVLPDGGHASRCPQAGLELLFDLLTLDEALVQRGQPPPEALSRAIDRLTAGLRFFTLADGRLACFQGGEACAASRVAAARAHDAAPTATGAEPPRAAPYAGYQRLDGPVIQVIADAGGPAVGAMSLAACGQPLAIEILCGRDRLITNCGWSPDGAGPQALRLAGGGSTAALGQGEAGAPLGGFLGRALGPRLTGGPAKVVVHRREADVGIWVDMEHDGWLRQYGLTHERRLFLDRTANELRGEDRFVPGPGAIDRLTPVDLHFHLHPDAEASLARDQRSVLLRGASNVGWWLRNDAAEVSIEPSVHYVDGQPRRSSQVVLRGRLRADRGGRVRWKLAPMDQPRSDSTRTDPPRETVSA